MDDSHYNLKGRSLGELEALFEELEEPRFRAKQAFRRVNLHLAETADEFTEMSKELRSRLTDLDALPRMELVRSSKDADGTEKALFQTGLHGREKEARRIEAVWIVSPRRSTICISSQVGCTLNCTFCATGTLPFRGNLPAWQIVEQVYEFMRRRKERPTNIVFMGMGEPFHNYDNVIKAARILHHPEGLNLGARHITISTAGVIPSIERFIKDKEPFNLAISLNHADGEERGNIMDIDRKYPMDKLIRVARLYTRELKRRITFEYVLIPDVNMGIRNAEKLIKIARSVNCKVNLIPLNTDFPAFRRPSAEEVEDFQEMLYEGGVNVFNRGSPGRSIDAACGMLALKD